MLNPLILNIHRLLQRKKISIPTVYFILLFFIKKNFAISSKSEVTVSKNAAFVFILSIP